MPATDWVPIPLGKTFALTVNINPASLNAGVTADTAVASSEILAGDHVIGYRPPAALNHGIAFRYHTLIAGSFQLALSNLTAGTIDVAAADWVFYIGRP